MIDFTGEAMLELLLGNKQDGERIPGVDGLGRAKVGLSTAWMF